MDEISLSAYVTAALLELGQPLTDPTVTRALQCLQESSRTSDLYTRALLAYAFGLAGRTELRDALLQSLAQHSVSAGTAAPRSSALPPATSRHRAGLPPTALPTHCPLPW
nr:alpha-2-macroglobulin-like protein 1 [Pelodiscus sinensis]|eukprot:XP_006117946.3 alpha-2-macroglobulin-like protein 1 [Pelodiscus sinensis]